MENTETIINSLTQWLATCPCWDSRLYVEQTPAQLHRAGLYCDGMEQVSRQEDVLGNVTVVNRCHFVLYRNVSGGDAPRQGQWLLQLQSWVRQQSALGLCPVFGDVPEREQLYAHEGKLKKTDRLGNGKYQVRLTAEFMKVYNKENEYGEN